MNRIWVLIYNDSKIVTLLQAISAWISLFHDKKSKKIEG